MSSPRKDTVGYFPQQNSIALFLDLDNFPRLRSGKRGMIGLLLSSLKPWGNIIVRQAYGKNLQSRSELCQELMEHKFAVTEITNGNKNSTDLYMTMEMVEMIHTRRGIQTAIIASGDGDFSSLVQRLRQHNLAVIGVGSRNSSSRHLARQCNSFLYFEDILGAQALKTERSQELKVGEDAMKTILRKYNLYPPDSQTRATMLKDLEYLLPKNKLPISYPELAEIMKKYCESKNYSRTFGRKFLNSMLRSKCLIFRDPTASLGERIIQEIVPRKVASEKIARHQVRCLVEHPDLILDPMAIASVVWGQPERMREMEKWLKEMKGV